MEYKFTVLAYIKNITYHDYATVDPAEVSQVEEFHLNGPAFPLADDGYIMEKLVESCVARRFHTTYVSI